MERKQNFFILPLLITLLIAIAGFLTHVTVFRISTPAPEQKMEASQLAQITSLADKQRPREFRIQDVPSWLFVHVGVIAALQVISVILALQRSKQAALSRADLKAVQFLCEIPMYLGLFGTLLGVCLTQFITGSLVAPLAYMTTMSGIVLHVLGKLTIWLPLPDEQDVED